MAVQAAAALLWQHARVTLCLGDQVAEKSETKTCIAKSQGPSLLLKKGLQVFQRKKIAMF